MCAHSLAHSLQLLRWQAVGAIHLPRNIALASLLKGCVIHLFDHRIRGKVSALMPINDDMRQIRFQQGLVECILSRGAVRILVCRLFVSSQLVLRGAAKERAWLRKSQSDVTWSRYWAEIREGTVPGCGGVLPGDERVQRHATCKRFEEPERITRNCIFLAASSTNSIVCPTDLLPYFWRRWVSMQALAGSMFAVTQRLEQTRGS